MPASTPLPCGAAVETSVTRPRVAEVFRRHAVAYRHAHVLTPDQARVLAALRVCRTAELGGFIKLCTECGFHHPLYHSCRDRHCPSCQAHAQGEWIERRLERVLPVKHFHVVFTVPAELRPIALRNGRFFYDSLFAAASETLQAFASKRFGATLGITTVLHTWTRKMLYHPHVHAVVTAGGLGADGAWVSARGRYLFNVHAMAKVFRAILRRRLLVAYTRQELDLGGDCTHLVEPRAFHQLIRDLFRKRWVVYSKASLAGPEQVFRYLGLYTHRVAISDQRLEEVTDDHVTFRQDVRSWQHESWIISIGTCGVPRTPLAFGPAHRPFRSAIDVGRGAGRGR